MQAFNRATQRFYCYGVDLNNPVDAVREGYYPIIENIRVQIAGEMKRRYGLSLLSTPGTAATFTPNVPQTPVHSIRRLTDGLLGSSSLIVGVGTKVCYGPTGNTVARYAGNDMAMSGLPLSMVPWRPNQSASSWMYVSDTGNQFKIRRDGTVHALGVAPPTSPPTVELGAFIAGSYLNFQNAAGWAVDAVVVTTAPAANVRIPAALTTTRAIYDSGAFGWCSVVLPATAMAVLGVGSLIDITRGGTTYTFPIHEIYRQSATIQIASIIYDSGTSGLATILPTQPVAEILRNAVILLDNGAGTTKYTRIISATEGPDGTRSFRCDTGIAAVPVYQTGNNIIVQPTIRIYDGVFAALTAGGGNAIAQLAINSGGAGVAGPPAHMTGWIQKDTAIDLSKITTISPWGSGAVLAAVSDDYLHISFKFSNLAQLVQGRIMFNCDPTIDYLKNFFYRTFTASDLTQAAKATQTALDARSTIIARDQLDDPVIYASPHEERAGGGRDNQGEGSIPGPDNPPLQPSEPVPPPGDAPDDPGTSRSQTGTGDSQWHELRFKISDLVRVGTDSSIGLANINSFRFEVTVNDTVAFTLAINSLDVWGTYPLDASFNTATPYFYRYRYRCSATGAVSNWSPAPLYGVVPMRGYTTVACTAASVTEADYIDVQRFGGLLQDWIYVGTVPASSSSLLDNLSDESILANAPFSEDDIHYQPWLTIHPRVSGSTANIAGTMVKAGAAPFNLGWVKGTAITIGGVTTTIRRVLSTTLAEIADSLSITGITDWEVTEPLVSDYLRATWISRGRMFACGDNNNPGTIYWTQDNDPDSVGENFRLDVTAPSEPLMAGCSFNDRNYVFSTDNLYEIIQTGDNSFRAQVVPNGRGLWAPWALCVGEKIWFLSRDGIYETTGGEAVSITDATLRPIFPKNGVLGVSVNGFNALNMIDDNLTVNGVTRTALSFFRLSYFQSTLYFTYVDTSNNYRTLRYITSAEQPGWFPDVYNPGIAYFYGGEGVQSDPAKPSQVYAGGGNVTTAALYQIADAANDAGNAVTWTVRTPSFDANDRRAKKLWGDLLVDADPGAGTINVAAAINNHGTGVTIAPTTITGAGRKQTTFDISPAGGLTNLEGRNFSIALTGTGSDAKLYLWEPSYIPRPEDILNRASDNDDLNLLQPKHFRGLVLEADTYNAAINVDVYGDNVFKATLSVNHNGRLEKPYTFTEFDAYEIKLVPTSGVSWKLFNYHWIYDPYPDNAAIPTPITDDGNPGAKYLYGVIIEADSTAAAINIAVKYDTLTATGAQIASTSTPTVTKLHNGRVSIAYHITSPVICHLMQLVPASAIKIFNVKWLWDPWPEYSRFTPDNSALADFRPKFVQGIRLEADTRDSAGTAQPITINVVADGVAVTSITATHDGRLIKPYSWTPFTAYEVKLVPQGDLRMFKVEWVWEPEPDSTVTWVSQQTSHGLKGFQHFRDAYICLQSAAQVTLRITRTDDNTNFDYPIASTGGLKQKIYVPLGPIKGKSFIYTIFSGSPFRLYRDDCEVRIKPWSSQEEYGLHNPFGGDHSGGAAKI